MSTVIKIENLSKQYIIGHQRQGKNTSLRDAIMHKLRGLGQRLCHPLSPNKEETILEEFWALKDINLVIKQGDRVGIIGRNGAGKSTLLKVLSRITEPTLGRISINGRVASLLEVGTGFHPELTGRENIFLNGAILGMSRADIKKNFDEIVAFAEVDKFLDTPVKRYSSGMYVRLAFAVAAHLDPDILIVDEVLAVGDATFQKRCLGKMGDIAKKGRTVLFVSHNMAAVQQLCERSLLIDSGVILKDGNVDETVDYYLNKLCKNETIKSHNVFNRLRQEGLGQLIRISKCSIFNTSGEESDSLRFAEPFSVEIECIGLSDVKHASFVIGIETVYGDRIATSLSEEKNCAVPIKKGQNVRVKLSIDNLHLKPGTYSITGGIRGIKGGLDFLQNIKVFNIVPLLHNNNIVPTDRPGIVHIQPNWSLN